MRLAIQNKASIPLMNFQFQDERDVEKLAKISFSGTILILDSPSKFSDVFKVLKKSGWTLNLRFLRIPYKKSRHDGR